MSFLDARISRLGVGQFGRGSHNFSVSPPAAGLLPNWSCSEELPGGC